MNTTIEIPAKEVAIFTEVVANLKFQGVKFTATLSADYFLITLS